MKVIVAGFCKTGTKTMNSALTKLGYNVYDFMDHYYYHEKYWTKIFKDGGTIEDFREMYESVDAVVDVPAFMFWEEMSEAFPEAKIILTTRDEDSWVISMKKQLEVPDDEPFFVFLIRLMCPSAIKVHKYFRAITPLAFGGRLSLLGKHDATSRGLRKRYRQHNLDVMQNAPKDKLLVYDVKKGWEPLCKFLEKDVPTTPFPWLNKNGSAITPMINEHQFGKEMQRELIFMTLLVTALIGCLIYMCVEKIQVFFNT